MVAMADIDNIVNYRTCKKGSKWVSDPRHQVTLQRYRPVIFDYFDVCFTQKGVIENSIQTNSIYCCNDHKYIDQMIQHVLSDDISYNVLVLAGVDRHLSNFISKINQIKHRFEKIYCETKDVDCDWVHTIPMGLIMMYVYRNGLNTLTRVMTNKIKKESLIGTAFGSIYPRLNKLSDRDRLIKYTKTNDVITHFQCPPSEYFERLSKFQYFACPLGNGLQTPKLYECLLTETIPVVTDHIIYRDLQSQDVPVLIVNDWRDVTSRLLDTHMSKNTIDWVKVKRSCNIQTYIQKYVKNSHDPPLY